MGKAIAVLGADIHYNINTLEIADRATQQMVEKANFLGVPLILAGDTHDSKALHRDECQEALLNTLGAALSRPIILVGNHCRRNEKSPKHSLHFLEHLADIISRPVSYSRGTFTATLIPYQHDPEDFKVAINQGNPLVICHQGITSGNMGHYVQDKSAVTKEDVENYRVISGHYHCRQDIKCGRPRKGAVGLFSYIGNPYTLTFGEAKDPSKGYQILMSDGLLEFVPTNLRRHRVFEFEFSPLVAGMDSRFVLDDLSQDDLIWLKVTGSPSELASINKEELGHKLFGHANYRLEKIPTQTEEPAKKDLARGPAQLLDALIDSNEPGEAERTALKTTWRGL